MTKITRISGPSWWSRPAAAVSGVSDPRWARRAALWMTALVAVAAAPSAHADTSLTLEGFGGWQNVRRSTTFAGTSHHGYEGTSIAGGDALVDFGGLALGLSVDDAAGGASRPWAGSILGGVVLDVLPSLRLEALGEIGRRATSFHELFVSDGASFVGLRPGVSIRLWPSSVRLGVSGIARWATSTPEGRSPTYGIVGRIGIDFR